MTMELRPYQREAVDAILGAWAGGVGRTLLVLPTGLGKTVCFAKVAEHRVREGDRVLVLAHRGELLEQAADKIFAATGLRCSTEKAEQSSAGAWERITVGSVQTMMQDRRLERFTPDHFGTIIVDEAHHAVSESYQKVLSHFPDAKVLGVTATPDRGDLRNLGTYFETIAYSYSLPQAIREGYLCRMQAQTIPLKIDMSSVGIAQRDFKTADIGSALEPYLAQIAAEMARYCKGRKTVVFLPLIHTSQHFCKLLREQGFRAAEVNGGSADRAETLTAFAVGEYDVLCNSMLLTEGWDCPSVDCIVVLRPTKVRSLYTQMIGRGTRLCDGKDHLLILDFLWHTERHEMCRPACLICDKPEVAKKMTENMEDGAATDLVEAEEKAAADAVADREAALAKMLEEQRHRKRALVDPLQFEMSIAAEDLAFYAPTMAWELAPPTEKQIKLLEKRGIFPDEIGSAGKAQLLIDRLIKRQTDGLTTPKQIRFLEGRGFRNVGLWQFTDASRMIGRISMNNWRIPKGVVPETYKPGGEQNAE